ncbi:peptidyl-prolyl cis-trans isomerase [Lentzea sp. NBRC 105346]|uniref:FKBP-type peptidyl-prolyl cis-trans isomerase n=1 Tax=Lentzea sp. NBRC 105346 TaxID=3032205 RepID=UPI0024A022EC|nr:FKBP-type peptidyl-prolyl cis-trans isomerase [Lentzea sp. NBRC 105346]GLZ28780.1 peptidyl-prolyl cis-trans isomerase [Lentzea sp. NBRC 105346]
MRNVLLIASLTLVAAATVGCTASDRPSTQTLGNNPTATAPKSSSKAPSSSTAPSGPACTADDFKVTTEPGKKPSVTVPATCSAPKELLTKDVIPGTGAAVKEGDTASVHYVLYTFSTKAENQASWDSGRPFAVQNVGKGTVIKGWNEGLIGLKQGGRRLLVVPPEKGYGDAGQGDIQPGETLVFVVDAIEVKSGS